MNVFGRHSRWLAVLSALVVALTIGGEPASAHRNPRTFQTTSFAAPTPDNPVVRSVVERRLHVAGRVVRASASASADTRCDNCSGEAVTFQVVYVPRSLRTQVSNTSSATASCTDCSSTSVSVQVVIARTRTLQADNSSQAINTECVRCTSNSAAYQFVLVSDRGRELSQRGRALVRAVELEMTALLASLDAPPANPAARTAQAPADNMSVTADNTSVTAALEDGGNRIAAILETEFGASVTSELDVSTG